MLSRRVSLLALTNLAILTAACGNGASTTGAGGSGHSASSGSVGGPGGAGAGGADAGAPSWKGGSVNLLSNSYDLGMGPMAAYSVSASFHDLTSTAGDAGATCTQHAPKGGCVFEACPTGLDTSSGPTPYPVAGDITVTSPTQTAVLTANSIGSYNLAAKLVAFWSPGDKIQIQAAGDAIPAFSQSVAGPGPLQLTVPSLSATLMVDSAKDLVFKWTGTGGDKMVIGLGAPDGSAVGFDQITCTFDAAAGQGSVPASLLAQLPKGVKGNLGAQVKNVVSVQAGEFAIDLVAITAAQVGTVPANGTLIVQ